MESLTGRNDFPSPNLWSQVGGEISAMDESRSGHCNGGRVGHDIGLRRVCLCSVALVWVSPSNPLSRVDVVGSLRSSYWDRLPLLKAFGLSRPNVMQSRTNWS